MASSIAAATNHKTLFTQKLRSSCNLHRRLFTENRRRVPDIGGRPVRGRPQQPMAQQPVVFNTPVLHKPPTTRATTSNYDYDYDPLEELKYLIMQRILECLQQTQYDLALAESNCFPHNQQHPSYDKTWEYQDIE